MPAHSCSLIFEGDVFRIVRTSDQRKRSGELVALVPEITNEDLLCSFLNGTRPLQAILTIVGLRSDGDSRMSMFLDIVAALLACGMATAWVLTGGEKLPPDWALRTGSTDKVT